MKVYILETKKIAKDQASKTPVLNKSNFSSLLSAGGRTSNPIIQQFSQLTPLIESVKSARKNAVTTYINPGQRGGYHNPAGVLATPHLRQQ